MSKRVISSPCSDLFRRAGGRFDPVSGPSGFTDGSWAAKDSVGGDGTLEANPAVPGARRNRGVGVDQEPVVRSSRVAKGPVRPERGTARGRGPEVNAPRNPGSIAPMKSSPNTTSAAPGSVQSQ